MDILVFKINSKELAKFKKLNILVSILEVKVNLGVINRNIIELANKPLHIITIEEVKKLNCLHS